MPDWPESLPSAPISDDLPRQPVLTAALASEAVQAAVEACAKQGKHVTAAVVDQGGNLRALFDPKTEDWLAIHFGAVEAFDDTRDFVDRRSGLNGAGFTAAAGGDLRLDHHGAGRGFAGREFGARCHKDARRNGNAVGGQKLLAVMFEQEHAQPRLRRGP